MACGKVEGVKKICWVMLRLANMLYMPHHHTEEFYQEIRAWWIPIPFESIVDSWSIFSLHFLYSRTHHINKKLNASVVLMVCWVVLRLLFKFWQVFLFLDPPHRRDNKKWRCKNRPKFFTWCCELPDFDFSNFCFASILLYGVASNIYDVVKREAPPRCFKV